MVPFFADAIQMPFVSTFNAVVVYERNNKKNYFIVFLVA